MGTKNRPPILLHVMLSRSVSVFVSDQSRISDDWGFWALLMEIALLSLCTLLTPPKQGLCNFSPGTTNLFNIPMFKCVLPSSFSALTNTTFTVTNTEVANAATVPYMDNLIYTTKEICCA